MNMIPLRELDRGAIERIRTGEIKAFGRRNRTGMPEPIPAHHFAGEVGTARCRARDLPVEGSALRAANELMEFGRIREPTKPGIWIDVENAMIWNDGNVEWSDIVVERVAVPAAKNRGGPPRDWDWDGAWCFVVNEVYELGFPDPRENLVRMVADWFRSQYGNAPDDSYIRKKLKPMWDLREAKLGKTSHA